jgi:hypothetical protein
MHRRWWLFWRNMSGFRKSHVNNGLPVDIFFAAVKGVSSSQNKYGARVVTMRPSCAWARQLMDALHARRHRRAAASGQCWVGGRHPNGEVRCPPRCHTLRNKQSRGVGLGVDGELPGGAGEVTKEMHELEQSRSRRQ